MSGFLTSLLVAPGSFFQNRYLKDVRGFSAARISAFTLVTNTPGGIGIIAGGRLADQRGRRVVGAVALVGGTIGTVVMFMVGGWPMWVASMAGAVVGPRALVGDPITAFLRTAGPTLSPFNAWVVLKGLETLELRMLAQSAAALELARWLEEQPNVARVHHPGLESHPQHALAKRQQRAAGPVLSFEVKGGR